MKAVSIRTALTALALVAPLALPSSASAESPSDVVVVVGTGTITPGLPTTGCTSGQVVKFTAVATIIVGDETNLLAPLSFTGGSSICESAAAGAGSGTLTGGITGSVNYTRTGNVVTLTGGGTIGTEPHTIAAGACVFVPTSVGPTTSYTLACTVVLDS